MTKMHAGEIIGKIIKFLGLFMTERLAKRVVSMVLLTPGPEKNRVTELTGLCARSVHALKKEMESGKTEELFILGHKGKCGGKSKMKDVEKDIIDEIEKNDYHTYQQIADMVEDKYGIKVPREAIRRLLKKTK
jgi:transposase